MIKGEPINVFNNGDMKRDFTYIDDIAEGVVRILEQDVQIRSKAPDKYKIYNIGNNKSVKLLDFIQEIEKNLNMKAKKNLLPMQPGDVSSTWANVDDLIKDFNYHPKTSINEGVTKFIKWYRWYYKI